MAQAPVLVLQLHFNADCGAVELEIQNVGAGTARGVRFCVVAGDEFVAGYAGPNFGGVLGTDEIRIVRTDLNARSGEALGVLTCLDRADRVHVSSLDGEHVVRSRSGRDVVAATDPLSAFTRCHSDVDLDALRRVGGRALRRQGGK